jgi:hypothetical protein
MRYNDGQNDIKVAAKTATLILLRNQRYKYAQLKQR